MTRYDEFHALHRPGTPLLLPNAWDVASAAALAAAGHPAIGTTSLGVAAAAGKPDAAAAARVETVALARALGRLPALLTVDIEAGFTDVPAEVADLVAELAGTGVVGVNLEDGRPGGGLDDPARHSAKIELVREQAPQVFLNARVDTYWADPAGGDERLVDTVARARRYLDAGADGIFVPGLARHADIETVVDGLAPAPLNVLFLPDGHVLPELAALGVARVSTGSLLFRAALGTAVAVADALRAGGRPEASGIPGYAEVQRLAENRPDRRNHLQS
ncbi:isocitrate lyase/phosphoenolpyruvate mutase family protein [Plantactinospora siamensis]|uniref:Isocitrate lyase/phosphoenolpyruvate mutase family protein n=1 Tax=Plantactinospora siamensis TaxID=555372 RepID=A0ABV6NXK4_9ACTN